jgi:hypothetical protein
MGAAYALEWSRAAAAWLAAGLALALVAKAAALSVRVHAGVYSSAGPACGRLRSDRVVGRRGGVHVLALDRRRHRHARLLAAHARVALDRRGLVLFTAAVYVLNLV